MKYFIAMFFLMMTVGVFAKPNGLPPGPPIFDTNITNDTSSPVPVIGNVEANIQGEVEVIGIVDVNSVPQSLTDQMQELISAVEALSLEEGNVEPAQITYLSGEISCSFTLGCSDIVLEGDNQATWQQGLLISSITIGSENDEMVVNLYDGDDNRIAKYGAENESLRGPINHLTFPDPLLAYRLTVLCRNTGENCEFEITVAGRPYN